MSLQLATFKRFLGGSKEEVESKGGVDGDLAVSQYMPAGALVTSTGAGYQAMTTTAGAALVVRPTTVPLATLYNGENGGGKSYIIERAFTHCLVSSAASESRFAIWLCVHPAGTDEDIADTITTKNNTAGKAGYAGNANLALATAVADDGWFPWSVSQDVEPTGVLPGAVAIAEVNGRIILPPRASLSIAVVASLVSCTFVAGFHWYERQIDLG